MKAGEGEPLCLLKSRFGSILNPTFALFFFIFLLSVLFFSSFFLLSDRYSAQTIEQRKADFEKLLRQVTQSPQLVKSPAFVKFVSAEG